MEKVTEKVVREPFVRPLPGPPLEPKSTKKREKVVPRSTLENTVLKVLHRRCLGHPPTLKIMVSHTRNHCSHISICGSRTTPNCVQWAPLWDFLDGFGNVGDDFGG